MAVALRKLDAHVWEREPGDHYVDPAWCSMRLFDEEKFGQVHDPCCGFGTIVKSAWAHGLSATGADITPRGFGAVQDFFQATYDADCIVSNPPFGVVQKFARHALKLAARKVAMIFPVARLNAAHWLVETPLRRIWLLSPRPSMLPGHMVTANSKPASGGKQDFCWLVWERGYTGSAELRWLNRDGKQ